VWLKGVELARLRRRRNDRIDLDDEGVCKGEGASCSGLQMVLVTKKDGEFDMWELNFVEQALRVTTRRF
jgi:hypothetical protein